MTRNVLERAAGVPDRGPLAEAVAFRGRLMALTQQSHDAALRPADPGGLDHGLRAALACRIARICGDGPLAEQYAAMAEGTPAAGYCDPITTGSDPAARAILAYADKVTRSPAAASGGDIDALREAGVAEPDIVRLAGLVAFVNYQLRVAQVMRRLGGAR